MSEKSEESQKLVQQEQPKLTASQINEEPNSFFDLRTKRGQLLFFAVTLLAACLVQCLPKEMFTRITNYSHEPLIICNDTTIVEKVTVAEKKPQYWVYGQNLEAGHLRHVHHIMERIGFNRVPNDTTDWDVLWAHDYPFRKIKMHNLKPHQRVNHFPGSGYLTNKVDLATSDIKYIPKAFKLPKDEETLRDYAAINPTKLFVQKHNQHRHIFIKSLDEINFKDNDTFVQEFIDNPLLVDGHKFDIGVYTIITSIDPLRVYIYKGDVLFRYCPVKYYPFDAKNVDKYIVGDDYLPTWEVPSLTQYYTGLGFGMKDSFDAYLVSKGKDPTNVWKQVEDAIRLAILDKEGHIADILTRYASKRNFFEMMRFDLVITDDLKVYLMEANMSPNLSSAHFKQNTILYEQVIYNIMKLIGVGSDLSRESLRKRGKDAEIMLSTDKNIVVDAVRCSQVPCTESCAPLECRLCKPCLTPSDLTDLHLAYREHMNRGDNKRIFPIPLGDEQVDFDKLTPKNQFITKWFEGKCKMDQSWCY